jgi:probable rRNA maturation factor
MKLNIEIRNLTRVRLDEKLIRAVILLTLQKSGLKFLLKKNISVSVAFVPPAEIRKLNRTWRKIDCVTDILSFPEYRSAPDLKKDKKSAIFLGELIICPHDIRKYSRKNKLVFKKELAKVISHGILHLIGFEHGKKMFSIQEKISSKSGK